MGIPIIITLLGLEMFLRAPALAETSPTEIKRLADLFKTQDGLARLIVFEKFEKSVPPGERAGILSKMWDTNKDDLGPSTRMTVMAYLVGKATNQAPWDPGLQDRIFSAAKHPNKDMRQMTLNILVHRNSPELRTRLLEFLEDPDDVLRAAVLIEFGRRPDGVTILKDYVKTHQGKKDRAASLLQARFFLKKAQRKPR
jgi:hypothetical protein